MPKLSSYSKAKGRPATPKNTEASLAQVSTRRQKDTFSKAASKLEKEYKRRCQDKGVRLFRHPDGLLREERPPKNLYAVANRKSWQVLVQYCRENGGDEEFTKTGMSYRYGIGVEFEEHKTLTESVGLETEVDHIGEWIGFDPACQDPLANPLHPFNSFFKNEAGFILNQVPTKVGVKPC